MSHRYGDHPERVALIQSLREVADFLAAHPQVPTERDIHPVKVRIGAEGSDSEKIAFVRQVARELDVDPTWGADNSHFVAVKKFGQVRLECIAILAKRMARHAKVIELGEAAVDALEQLAQEPAAAAEPVELPAATDPDGFEEIECVACQGTGEEQQGSCRCCLGKGRVLAPAAQELTGTGGAW